MKPSQRIITTASISAIAALALAGCASGTPEERSEALANDFVTWAIEDATPGDVNQEEVEEAAAENPFAGICEGAFDRAISQLVWIQGATEVDDIVLEKSESDSYWFVVNTLGKSGNPSDFMPVRIDTVDGDLCVAAAGDAATA